MQTLADAPTTVEDRIQIEDRFALAMRGCRDGIWDRDLRDGSAYFSPRYAQLLGYELHQLDELDTSYAAWSDRIHPDDRDRVVQAFNDHLERRTPYDIEYRVRIKSGEYRWFHSRGQAAWDARGRACRVAGWISDITERVTQNQTIAETVSLAEFMRDIALTLTGDTSLDHMLRNCAQLAVHRLDVAFSRIWTIDPSGTMLELKASAGLYSHTNGPHARIPVGQFKIGQIARERRPHLTNAVIGDPKIHDQDWATREQMVAFAGYPLLVGQRLVGVWAMFSRKPISERTLTAVESVAHGLALGIEKCEATLALRESMADTRKLAMVASRTSNAVIITCPNGKIEWVNDSFVSMTEYHLAEVLGRKPGSFLQGPKTDHETINLMRECLRDGRGFKTEILNYSKSGREYWLAIDTQPIRDSAGNITNFVAVESDITSSKLLVAELDRSNKELEQFAYVASHDLQEPLRIISSFAQLLARRYKNQLDADANDFIAFIVDGAVRMQTLINDLLAYSRVGTRGNEKRPVRLDDTLDRALANLRVAIDESHAEFTRDPLPTLMADASQITQLFQNLVGNALKYRAADPPRIHISAQQEGNEWLISIRDNGIGIDPLYLERIFVIFQRLHTREQYPGTGIGLAICQKIVERHGGRIWVDSKQGQGSIFHFTLPIGANGS